MRVGVQRQAPVALPPGKTRYPLYRRLCGHQGRSEQVRKTLTPPGFDPRAIQPVMSHYIDWAIPAHQVHTVLKKTILLATVNIADHSGLAV